ncbi:hypothetical protein [Malaciobacter canalis]|uniref:hypothetical protein n=1 Tax=Malaciobacter canalis TaxID=1912871 RepID=UPI00384AE663
MPKFEEAYYLENDVWNPVSYRELTDPNRRAELKEKKLRNEKNGTIVLGIRNHETTPHFYEKFNLRVNIDKGVIETEEHDRNKNILKNFLKKYPKNRFGYYESPWEKKHKDKGFESFLSIKDYIWDTEVKFGLIYGKYIIFDVLGRSRNELTFTDSLPFVAIEVVDTHFHSKQTFKILLKLSKDLPIKVLYYFVSQLPSKYEHKEHQNWIKKPYNENVKNYANSKILCHLANGSFWFNNYRIEDTQECNILPENPDEYYNYILDFLKENDFIR